MLLILAADRLGRQRLLLGTILGYTVLTGATALAPDTSTFVVLQCCSRAFITAAVLLATVVIAEEFSPAVRGWGMGAANALAAGGYGLAWLLFALVEILPFGWRALYLVGLVPLGLLAFLRRTRPETVHFTEPQAQQPRTPAVTAPLAPLVALVRGYPGRLIATSAVALLMGLAESPALFFDPKYLQEVHRWQPWHISLLGACGGFVALYGYTYAGWLGDCFGRKRITLLFLSCPPLLTGAFYHAPSLLLAPLWVAMVFTLLGANVSISAYGAELCPTSYRATATGVRAVMATLGGVLGLALEGWLYTALGSHWDAISLLAVALCCASLIVTMAFPETSGRTLEDIAPER